MATLTPNPKIQFFDINGNPLVGGKLYSYLAGTTTLTPTYTDAGQGTQNANPVILDSRGEASVWLGTGVSYKLKLTTATDVDIWTVDNIINNVPSFGSGTAAAPAVVSSAQTNTGIYFPGSSLAVSLVGSELYRFTTTGLGLGATITSPAGILHARAAANAHIIFRDGNSFGAGSGAMVDTQDASQTSAQPLYLRASQFSLGTGTGVSYTDRFNCSSAGNVGINVAIPASEKLHVNGNIRVDGGNSVALWNSNNSNTYSLTNSGAAGSGNAQLDVVQSGASSRLRLTNTGQLDIRAGSGFLLMNGAVTRFASTIQALPATSGSVSVAHGGPRIPDMVRAGIRRNATAAPGGTVDASYSTGDEVSFTTSTVTGSAVATWANATTVGYSQYSATPNLPFKNGTGGNNNIGTTYWDLYLYCIWL